jgi:hypothetical protein
MTDAWAGEDESVLWILIHRVQFECVGVVSEDGINIIYLHSCVFKTARDTFY